MFILMSVFISVGFLTLTERKILSLTQLRLAPNKVLVSGILQPILDGFKLLKKNYSFSFKNMYIIYQSLSWIMLVVYLLFLYIIPFFNFGGNPLTLMYIMLMLSFASFCMLLLGWSAFNKFSFLGSIRSLSQNMSFEVNFGILLLMMCSLINKMKFNWINNKSIIMLWFCIVLWILLILELQRAPMDLSEGESELVSGYNIEFSSMMFTFIFMSEYFSIIIFSGVFWILIMSLDFSKWLVSIMLMLLMRSCFPRMRFDSLMIMFWFKILPLNLIIILFSYWIKIISGFLEKLHFPFHLSRSKDLAY